MITLRSDWYDADDGFHYVVIGVKGGAPHKLRFWCVAAARVALNRLTRPVAGPKQP